MLQIWIFSVFYILERYYRGDGVQSNQSARPHKDQKFIQTLYRDYQRLMYYIVRKYTSSPTECEDIVQECLEKLITKEELLKGLRDSALASYISVTARNTAISFLKRRSSERELVISLSDVDENTVADKSSLPEWEILHQEELQQFRIVWDQLDQETRMILEGKYILGYDDGELGQLLHCQSDSVRMKLTRARRKAKALLKESSEHDRS